MPVPMVRSEGATPLGAGDTPPSGASGAPVVMGAARADAGARVALGAPSLAANADSDGAPGLAAARAILHTPAGSTVHFGGSAWAADDLGSTGGTAPGNDAAGLAKSDWRGSGATSPPPGDTVIAAGLAQGAVDSVVSDGGVASTAPAGAPSEARGVDTGAPSPVIGFAPTTPVVVSGSTPGGLTFHIHFDSSVAGAPASFDTEVIAAFQYFANTFNNPGVALYYNVGYGEIGGSTIDPGALGESSTSFTGTTFSYSTLRGKLSAQAATGDGADKFVFANDVPATNPVSGMVLNMPVAEGKALGLVNGTSGSFSNSDGDIGFSKSMFSGGVPDPGFLGVVEHEISEVMGRTSGLDGLGDYMVMDLFRYAAPGVRQLSDTGNPSYFSLDNGKTDIYNWNNPSNVLGDGGDLGDWLDANVYTPDAYNDSSDTSIASPITSRDTTLMDVLGWDRATATNYTVAGGHTSSGIVIYSGDHEFVKSNGTAVATFAMSGGLEIVSAGGLDRTATLRSGAEQDVFGTARSVVVVGGTQVVASGGVASGGSVSNGGGQYSDPGGTAIGTTIGNGGFQAVYGGTATGTVVTSGGAQFVASGGRAVSAIVRSGGLEDVFSGGRSSRTIISRGGLETVSAGCVANATTISSGGSMTVSAGGVANGGTLKGGLMEVASGGTASGTVTFAGGGTLQLDTAGSFKGAIAGFAVPDRIDLRGVTSGATTKEVFVPALSGTSGTLTVTDGTHSVNLTLIGSYTTSSFKLATDKNGGTLVTDPPVAGGAPRLSFADIAPAKRLTGTAEAGNSPGYLAGTLALSEHPHAGQTLLPTGPPGAGTQAWLPTPR